MLSFYVRTKTRSHVLSLFLCFWSAHKNSISCVFFDVHMNTLSHVLLVFLYFYVHIKKSISYVIFFECTWKNISCVICFFVLHVHIKTPSHVLSVVFSCTQELYLKRYLCCLCCSVHIKKPLSHVLSFYVHTKTRSHVFSLLLCFMCS